MRIRFPRGAAVTAATVAVTSATIGVTSVVLLRRFAAPRPSISSGSVRPVVAQEGLQLILGTETGNDIYLVGRSIFVSAQAATPVQFLDYMQDRLTHGYALSFIIHMHESYSLWSFARSLYSIRPSENRSTALSSPLEPPLSFMMMCFQNYISGLLISLVSAFHSAGWDSSTLALLGHLRQGGRLVLISLCSEGPTYSSWDFARSIWARSPSETNHSNSMDLSNVGLEAPDRFILSCFRRFVQSFAASLISAYNASTRLNSEPHSLVNQARQGARIVLLFSLDAPSIIYSRWSFNMSLFTVRLTESRSKCSAIIPMALQNTIEFVEACAARYMESVALMRAAAIYHSIVQRAASSSSRVIQPASSSSPINNSEIRTDIDAELVAPIPSRVVRIVVLSDGDTAMSYSHWEFSRSLWAIVPSEAHTSSDALSATLQNPAQFAIICALRHMELAVLSPMRARAGSSIILQTTNTVIRPVQHIEWSTVDPVQPNQSINDMSTVDQVQPDLVQLVRTDFDVGLGPNFAPHHLLDPALRHARTGARAANVTTAISESPSVSVFPAPRQGAARATAQIPPPLPRTAHQSSIITPSPCPSARRDVGPAHGRWRAPALNNRMNPAHSIYRARVPAQYNRRVVGRCFACREPGHHAAHCPRHINNDFARGGGSHNGAGNRGRQGRVGPCFRCGLKGHLAVNCTTPCI